MWSSLPYLCTYYFTKLIILHSKHIEIFYTHTKTQRVCVCVCIQMLSHFHSVRLLSSVQLGSVFSFAHSRTFPLLHPYKCQYTGIPLNKCFLFSIHIPIFCCPVRLPPSPHTFCVPSVCVSLSSRLLFMFAVVFVCGVIFLIHFSLLKLCCWTYTWSAVTVVFVVFSLCSDYILSDFRSVAFRSSCRCRSKIQEWLYRFAICHLDSISIYSIFVPVHGVGKRA